MFLLAAPRTSRTIHICRISRGRRVACCLTEPSVGSGREGRPTQYDLGNIMQDYDGIVNAIGNTPLITLRRASADTRCTILGKAEFMNPGQSVKDRAALF